MTIVFAVVVAVVICSCGGCDNQDRKGIVIYFCGQYLPRVAYLKVYTLVGRYVPKK